MKRSQYSQFQRLNIDVMIGTAFGDMHVEDGERSTS